MNRELIIECIALLNTANFQETLNEKRNEVVNELKQQLIITDVVQAKPEKVCKGSWQIGNNCKTCKRCLDTKPS